MASNLEWTVRPTSTLARFLLDAPVLPLVTETLRVAEAFRNAVMSKFKHWCQHHPNDAEAFRRTDKPDLFSSPTLSGKDLSGAIRKDHRHAYYLPTAESDDGRWLTHVTVAASEGFGPGEISAFNTLRSLKLDDESADLRVQLVGLGREQDFRLPLLAESAVWVSATPFLATRHLKKRGQKKDPPELRRATPAEFAMFNVVEELNRLRQRRPDLPEVQNVELLINQVIGPCRLRPIQFRRLRRKTDDDGDRRAAGAFRIVFTQPVAGPISLGHSCHFGMGLFVPGGEL